MGPRDALPREGRGAGEGQSAPALPSSRPDLQEENKLAAGQETGRQVPLRGGKVNLKVECVFFPGQKQLPSSTAEVAGHPGCSPLLLLGALEPGAINQSRK